MGFWNWEVQASNPGLECLSPVFSHWVQKAKDVGLTEANQETSMTPISKIQQYGIEIVHILSCCSYIQNMWSFKVNLV